MKNLNEKSRRAFLSGSLKGALIVGAGSTLTGGLLEASTANGQTSDSALQAKVGALGAASLQTSQLAKTKASNAQVKLFANYEAAEQEAMGNILKDMGTVPVPSADGKAVLTKLQSLSGGAFDKAFMQAQVDTHQKLYQAVSALMNGSSSKDVKHVTSLALPTIKEHTERGQVLLGQLS